MKENKSNAVFSLAINDLRKSFDESQPDVLDLVLVQPLFRPIIKFFQAQALVRGHFLSVLRRAAIGEIGGNAGRSEYVAANRLGDAGRRSPASDYALSFQNRFSNEH